MKKTVIICPKCQKVKKFGEFVTITSLILMAIADKDVELINETCPKCLATGSLGHTN